MSGHLRQGSARQSRAHTYLLELVGQVAVALTMAQPMRAEPPRMLKNTDTSRWLPVQLGTSTGCGMEEHTQVYDWIGKKEWQLA